jgi:hypothetical protein
MIMMVRMALNGWLLMEPSAMRIFSERNELKTAVNRLFTQAR